ncbi:feruloyl CoA ortho-hydroxylase 1-like [Chenopodium quinoa]|uniref:feruloyl CoA ortho-hydroxylase 1-like n=1 Tax=Chenopodium quinoa TaxID=63459 RepID=UPI000B77A451|nr:feruloyl CoA ortho-hydroxylase 1-like [Chenopodium quinoa]
MPTTSITYLENTKDYVLNKGHGVKGLADMGIKSLPNQYIQPEEERFDLDKIILTNNGENNSIPIIDMSNLDDHAMKTLICNAAEKWGFFQLINHGMPLNVLEDVKAATYRFFELSAQEKSKFLKENSPTNNVRYGTSFVPEVERALEWKDYLSLFFVSEKEALACWPLACRAEALEYMKSSEFVIRNLLKILMKGLNIHEIDERKKTLLMGTKRINLNYYPKCPNPELTVAVGRHSDVSTLTILLQDDVGGLYVRGLDGESWIHVPPIDGALVINIGDALQILSNGKYKSVEHRVIANGQKNRVSIPIFVNPRPNDVIAPFEELMEGGDKPKYKEILYSDYVKYFFKKAHDGKATIDFAKNTN